MNMHSTENTCKDTCNADHIRDIRDDQDQREEHDVSDSEHDIANSTKIGHLANYGGNIDLRGELKDGTNTTRKLTTHDSRTNDSRVKLNIDSS